MRRRRRAGPTDGELEILSVLWRRGPSTVREVHEELTQRRPMGYTTALKLLQIMTEKGLVVRDESRPSHIYRARIGEEETQGQLVRDMLERGFGGSAYKLVMQALTAREASPEELASIRELLDRLAGGGDDAD